MRGESFSIIREIKWGHLSSRMMNKKSSFVTNLYKKNYLSITIAYDLLWRRRVYAAAVVATIGSGNWNVGSVLLIPAVLINVIEHGSF